MEATYSKMKWFHIILTQIFIRNPRQNILKKTSVHWDEVVSQFIALGYEIPLVRNRPLLYKQMIFLL